MEPQKDIRFSDKKIDEGWKEQVATKAEVASSQARTPVTSKVFLNLVQSVGVQALMHLGAMPDPITHETGVNLEAAKATIDVLVALKDKTAGNLSPEEKQFLDSLLSELQVKFSQSV